MFIKKLDILSPYITLYFKGEKKHSSKFSGILSLITFLLVLITSIYYIVEFVNKKSPKAYLTDILRMLEYFLLMHLQSLISFKYVML